MKRIGIIMTLSMSLLFIMQSCMFDARTIRGTGDLQSKIITTRGFDAIELNSIINLEISQSETQEIKIEAQENLMELIEVYVYNNTLYIDAIKSYNLRPEKPITVYIATPEIQSLSAKGTGNILGTERFQLDSPLNLSIDGTGDIDFAWDYTEFVTLESDGTGDMFVSGNASDLYVDIDGTGNLHLDGEFNNSEFDIDGTGSCFIDGQTKSNHIKIDGTGGFYGLNFISKKSSVKIDGTGNAEVFAIESLSVSINGSGNVYYSGNPNELFYTGNGSGKLIAAQ
ncbi:MAG: DUF2807 domain-containing protein [Bacteroidales bacterium]|nr:DUF2807 domain-containing protein [Bacteroidales bacterium]